MGCDMHAHVEYKIGDRWFDVSFETVRHYDLFGRLAGVRGGEAMVKPRGFPPDASFRTQQNYEYWGVNAHTPSWLTIAELEGARDVAPEFVEAVEAVARYHADDPSACRLVFWFDN